MLLSRGSLTVLVGVESQIEVASLETVVQVVVLVGLHLVERHLVWQSVSGRRLLALHPEDINLLFLDIVLV